MGLLAERAALRMTTKIQKQTEPEAFELEVAQAICDLEANSNDLKAELRELYIVGAKEVDVTQGCRDLRSIQTAQGGPQDPVASRTRAREKVQRQARGDHWQPAYHAEALFGPAATEAEAPSQPNADRGARGYSGRFGTPN